MHVKNIFDSAFKDGYHPLFSIQLKNEHVVCVIVWMRHKQSEVRCIESQQEYWSRKYTTYVRRLTQMEKTEMILVHTFTHISFKLENNALCNSKYG